MTFTSKIQFAPRPVTALADTILVVDDQPSLCEVASLFLQRFGYRVLTANDGEQAKKIAREDANIDLLLTEIEMPVMFGDELAEWFRVTRPDTAVVLMSGNPMQRLRLEPRFFVEKPFVHLDTLVKTIRAALQQNRAAHQAASIAA